LYAIGVQTVRRNPVEPAPALHLRWLTVIDLRALRETPEEFRRSQQARGEDPGLVDAALAADEGRR
jgi:hypothetical protein